MFRLGNAYMILYVIVINLYLLLFYWVGGYIDPNHTRNCYCKARCETQKCCLEEENGPFSEGTFVTFLLAVYPTNEFHEFLHRLQTTPNKITKNGNYRYLGRLEGNGMLITMGK